ncbi:hypothetical protein SOM70_37510 [Streptomyces salinarius]|uniref:hypothetical protein n=1 Tax=Streptomyces salinarius TaxID=2762598 RepID=UPI0032E028F3
MDKLIDLLVNATIAFFAWRLTNLSRDRADRAAQKESLRAQADALTVAVLDLRHAAASNRILWEGPSERGRSFLLALMSHAGGVARAQDFGASDRLAATAGMAGQRGRDAGRRPPRDQAARRHGARTRAPPRYGRRAPAASPGRDPVASTAAELTTAALAEGEDTARVEAALTALESALRAALEPAGPPQARRGRAVAR